MVLLVVTEVVTTRPAAALVVTRPLVVLRLVVDWAATRPLERRLAVDRAAIRPLVVLRLAVDRAAIRPLERRLVVGVELRLSFRERAYHTLDKNDLRGTTYGHIERRR